MHIILRQFQGSSTAYEATFYSGTSLILELGVPVMPQRPLCPDDHTSRSSPQPLITYEMMLNGKAPNTHNSKGSDMDTNTSVLHDLCPLLLTSIHA